MSVFNERVKQDLIKLNELTESTGNKVVVVNAVGNPVNRIEIELKYVSVPSSSYPVEKQNITKVRFDLLSRYPLQEPSATITTPIYHPNVYSSGKICFGDKWLPSYGLDLLTKRVIQIITFDPLELRGVLNGEAPANSGALSWYLKTINKHPDAFPSDRYVKETSQSVKPKIKWGAEPKSSSDTGMVIINCRYCENRLRIPKGKSLNVTCPRCKNKFGVKT